MSSNAARRQQHDDDDDEKDDENREGHYFVGWLLLHLLPGTTCLEAAEICTTFRDFTPERVLCLTSFRWQLFERHDGSEMKRISNR